MKNARHFGKAFLLWASTFLLVIIPGSYAIGQTCISPPSGLVSWWPGDTDASDIQGGNDGVLTNGALAGVPGKVSGAFSFDGVDAHVKISASPNYAGSGLTIDGWINPSDVSLRRPILEWHNGVGFFGFGVHIWLATGGPPGFVPTPGNLFANIIDTSLNNHFIVSPGNIVGANADQHIALTYDQLTGIAALYLNGVLVKQENLGIFTPETSFDLFFGKRVLGTGANIKYIGTLDEVEIFNRALSGGEIQAIFNADSAGKCKGVNVAIDIKPGSDPNSINPRSKGKIPVAILTTNAGHGDPLDFDATQVDALSVEFGPDGAAEAHGRAHIDDVDGDGDMDMVLHFKTKETGIACGDTEASLTGITFSGDEIEGSDSINTVGCK